MRRATTPTIGIAIDIDLTGYQYQVIFAQKDGVKIVKTQDDCELSEDGKIVYVEFTQEETLKFTIDKYILVQIKFGIGDWVSATNIASTRVSEILDEKVIQWEI